jgi:hypothetical protein
VLRGSEWHSSPVLVRAALGSAALSVVAVVMGRPDLLVLATPLLVHAVAAVAARPRRTPVAAVRLGTPYVREGEGTQVRVTIDRAEDVEHAVFALVGHKHVVARPAAGVVGATEADRAERRTLEIPVASLRWGRRRVGDGLVAGTSPWGGYAWGPVPVFPQDLTVLPQRRTRASCCSSTAASRSAAARGSGAGPAPWTSRCVRRPRSPSTT